jgi:ECF sigma factor
VKHTFFGGLKEAEVAERPGLPITTVKRDWKVARAWLIGQPKAGLRRLRPAGSVEGVGSPPRFLPAQPLFHLLSIEAQRPPDAEDDILFQVPFLRNHHRPRHARLRHDVVIALFSVPATSLGFAEAHKLAPVNGTHVARAAGRPCKQERKPR